MTEPPIPPPPRSDGTPRMKSSRVEALRAAAKVHEGTGAGQFSTGAVLDTAQAFELWLTEQDT